MNLRSSFPMLVLVGLAVVLGSVPPALAKKHPSEVTKLRKQCDRGNKEACVKLGGMYRFGIGVKQDFKKAMDLFRKACAGEYAVGCSMLGVMYENGAGLSRDNQKALEYYGKACNFKSEMGCNNYARLNKQNR
jgi:TPR repeat protein